MRTLIAVSLLLLFLARLMIALDGPGTVEYRLVQFAVKEAGSVAIGGPPVTD